MACFHVQTLSHDAETGERSDEMATLTEAELPEFLHRYLLDPEERVHALIVHRADDPEARPVADFAARLWREVV